MPNLDPAAVSARAYALYVRRGKQPGRAVEDWVEAERLLKAEALAAKPPLAPATPAEKGKKSKKPRK